MDFPDQVIMSLCWFNRMMGLSLFECRESIAGKDHTSIPEPCSLAKQCNEKDPFKCQRVHWNRHFDWSVSHLYCCLRQLPVDHHLFLVHIARTHSCSVCQEPGSQFDAITIWSSSQLPILAWGSSYWTSFLLSTVVLALWIWAGKHWEPLWCCYGWPIKMMMTECSVRRTRSLEVWHVPTYANICMGWCHHDCWIHP